MMLDAVSTLMRFGPVVPLYGVQELEDGTRLCGCNRADCTSPGKHPMTRNGLSDASADPAQIRDWFTKRPSANIGLVTGRVIVVDIDPRHGGDEALTALEREHGPLPHTVRALTGGGGEHIFFAPSIAQDIRNSTNRVGPGIDVRGAGGYIVAPPSLHITGRRYSWSIDHHPDETPLAKMPDWMLARLRQPTSGPAKEAGEWVAMIEDGIGEGGRNDAVASLAGHLLRRYVDPEVTFALIKIWNEARCRPPLTEREIWATVNSIAGKELKRREAQLAGRG